MRNIPTPAQRIRQAIAAPMAVALAVVASPAPAQSLFSAAVHVNDDIVTYYEIQQRALFMEVVRTPGNLEELALEALVNERLQLQEAERAGLVASPEEIEEGVVEFDGRAELGVEQFLQQMGEEGIAPETIRDFVANGISWRKVIQGRFSRVARADDAEVEEALLLGTDLDSAQILLAEIVVPLTPQNAEVLEEEIGRLSQNLNGNIEDFSEAARRFSAAQTRDNGGVTGWRPFSAVPPALLEYLQFLRPGETSLPVSLGPAYAIFQMRGIRETGLRQPPVRSIDYATIPLPSIQTEEGRAAAAQLRADIDVCDDLYGQRPGGFERQSAPLREISTDIGLALSTLDAGEISFDVFRGQGGVTLAVMLCAREVADSEEALAAMRGQLFSQGLQSYADGLLEELRADAIIIYN